MVCLCSCLFYKSGKTRQNALTFSVSSPAQHFYFALPLTEVLSLPFLTELELSSSSCSLSGAAFLLCRPSLLRPKSKSIADKQTFTKQPFTKFFSSFCRLFFCDYTLFQNGRHFSILLFACKLALVASFLNSKLKRIFYLERGYKG